MTADVRDKVVLITGTYPDTMAKQIGSAYPFFAENVEAPPAEIPTLLCAGFSRTHARVVQESSTGAAK